MDISKLVFRPYRRSKGKRLSNYAKAYLKYIDSVDYIWDEYQRRLELFFD